MKTSFDALRGIWKASTKPLEDMEEDIVEELPEPEEDPEYIPGEPVKPQEFKGKCVLSVRFENEEDYQKWLQYNPGRKWDFLVSYPAMIRAEYIFTSSLDVEVMVKKIVQLLSMGFDVYSAGWKLEEKEGEPSCGKTEE